MFQEFIEILNTRIEVVKFDSSTQSYSLNVIAQIKDDLNRVIGLLKAGFNLRFVSTALDNLKKESNYHSLQYYLLNGQGHVVLTSRHTGLTLEERSDPESPYHQEIREWEPVKRVLNGRNGFHPAWER
ncbi:hypothetical protein NITGR_250029 [Nitrospina gracilis 3/211]|uniref:Uncharacterized protein n=1 Tax=Nitrospina gracilis (strain 3/211) TaxID=1266370 RepID=M1YWS1_NITG3|nr:MULTISPECIES: cache domain-containing protein [Nitrospina]MCF8723079.1 hypothetical protein [Nitrospina sp. Nb-3]CCQ90116.1 hypothetical protein NITGR_250029 [Nitrospina gracilis 3/211]